MEGAYINTLIKSTKYGPQLNVGLFGLSTDTHVTFTKHSDTFGIKVKQIYPPTLPAPPRDRPSPVFMLRDADGTNTTMVDDRLVIAIGGIVGGVLAAARCSRGWRWSRPGAC